MNSGNSSELSSLLRTEERGSKNSRFLWIDSGVLLGGFLTDRVVRDRSLKRSSVSRSAGGREGGATELETETVSWELSWHSSTEHSAGGRGASQCVEYTFYRFDF